MPESSITVLHREPSAFISTSFNEILTCRLPDGRVRRLLLKRGANQAENSFGHHGGVPYEAQIYRRVLHPIGTSTPFLHDSYTDESTLETVMLIDYLEDARRLSKVERKFLYGAAAWIGKFHRINATRIEALSGLVRTYDAEYYRGWMQRTMEYWSLQNPWLEQLHSQWRDLAAELQAAPTVIHGEYYPKNILVHSCEIAPIDWETTAIGAGEIDLACLTERWPDADRTQCELEYVRSRWPAGAPAGFPRSFLIAEIYVQLRWLGHFIIGQKQARHRLPRLEYLCRRLGLLRD